MPTLPVSGAGPPEHDASPSARPGPGATASAHGHRAADDRSSKRGRPSPKAARRTGQFPLVRRGDRLGVSAMRNLVLVSPSCSASAPARQPRRAGTLYPGQIDPQGRKGPDGNSIFLDAPQGLILVDTGRHPSMPPPCSLMRASAAGRSPRSSTPTGTSITAPATPRSARLSRTRRSTPATRSRAR